MSITYRIAYDVDDDGTFRGNLTPDTIAAAWRLGMRHAFDDVADVGEAKITVRSPDGRYAPESALSGLRVGLTLRITSYDGVVNRTHFTGTIHHVIPQAGEHGERLAVIVVRGALGWLRDVRVSLGTRTNVRADEVVNAVLDRVPVRVRYLAGAFMVGTPGRAELGITTRLPAAAALIPRTIQRGVSTFAYVGDTWDGGVRALDAVREVVAAERGRFYVDRDGGFVMLNRHELLTRLTPAAAFSDDMDGVAITYGADVTSRVRVTLRPRQLSIEDGVLWSLGQAQRIASGEVQRFTVRFRSSDGGRVGALNVRTPRRFSDYTANSSPAGDGDDLTAKVTFTLLGYDGASADVQLSSSAPVDAYLLPGSVIRGRAVYTGNPITVMARAPAAETLYGVREFTLSLPGLESVEQAGHIAHYELSRRSQPRGTVTALTLESHAQRPQVLARTLFDRITVNEAQSAHGGDYFIVGASHQVTDGGAAHAVTWTLAPANPAGFWMIGVGRLDVDTRLAY